MTRGALFAGDTARASLWNTFFVTASKLGLYNQAMSQPIRPA